MPSRARDKRPVLGEFHLRGQNSRLPPLRLQWSAAESLYYGGQLSVAGGPTSMQTRFARRMDDLSWLKNDPTRIAGGRPFTESFFATAAVLMAFADAERLVIETVQSPVPLTSTSTRVPTRSAFTDIEEFDRTEMPDVGEATTRVSGTLKAG